MEVADKHWCSCSLTYKETLKSATQTRNGRFAFKIKVGILAICQANLLHFHLQPMASSYICGLASICRQTERPTGNYSSLLATKAVNRSSTFFATSFNQPQPAMSKNHCQPQGIHVLPLAIITWETSTQISSFVSKRGRAVELLLSQEYGVKQIKTEKLKHIKPRTLIWVLVSKRTVTHKHSGRQPRLVWAWSQRPICGILWHLAAT